MKEKFWYFFFPNSGSIFKFLYYYNCTETDTIKLFIFIRTVMIIIIWLNDDSLSTISINLVLTYWKFFIMFCLIDKKLKNPVLYLQFFNSNLILLKRLLPLLTSCHRQYSPIQLAIQNAFFEKLKKKDDVLFAIFFILKLIFYLNLKIYFKSKKIKSSNKISFNIIWKISNINWLFQFIFQKVSTGWFFGFFFWKKSLNYDLRNKTRIKSRPSRQIQALKIIKRR